MPPKGRRGRPRGSGRSASSRGDASSRGEGRSDRTPIETPEVEIRIESPSSSSPSSASESDDHLNPDATPITIHSQKYYKAEDMASKRKRKKKTSYIWNNGFEIIHAEKGTKHYYCQLCLDEGDDLQYKPLAINGTSSILSHFRSKHNLDRLGNPVEKPSSVSSRASSASCSPTPVFQFSFERFKLLLVHWIVFCHVAFLQVENEFFRDLLNFLNQSLCELLPSRNTFRGWVVAEFKKEKRRVRKELKKARSKIHLSFDLWTSPNFYSIAGIVAHFIDSNGYRQTQLLAIRHLKGHSGANIAESVYRVIREYRIQDQVGFFVLDNASSNDVAVDCILRMLDSGMPEDERKGRRIRCLAHVINLVAKAFLLGGKAETVADELVLAERHEDDEEISRIWKKQGALGKLQNLVRHIRSSPKRRQQFKECETNKESWKEFNKLEV